LRAAAPSRRGAPESFPGLACTFTAPAPDGLDSILETAAQLAGFLDTHGIGVLNVAGSRESKEPGVYPFTLAVLPEYWQPRGTNRRGDG
jgi:hypothetical protein